MNIILITDVCSILNSMFLIQHIMCSIHTLVGVCGSALPLPSLARDGHSYIYFFLAKKVSSCSLLSYWHRNAMWQRPDVLESMWGIVGHFFYGIANRHNHSSQNSKAHISLVAYVMGLACSFSHLVLFRPPPPDLWQPTSWEFLVLLAFQT